MLLTEGQVSDYKGAVTMPDAPVLIADRGHDADWFRQALAGHPTLHPLPYQPLDADPTRQGALPPTHNVEAMFGRLKDWRRIATRYDQCAHVFMSAIALAATLLFWLPRK